MNYDKVQEAVEYLGEISRFEGTEQGEKWEALELLWNKYPYCSEEFVEALAKEILSEYEYVKENYILIEKEEIHTYNTKELIYKNE